jgi:hypothetical protein
VCAARSRFGGINFFSDKARAGHEMIPAAKSGTKIVLSDETEKHVKVTYEKALFTGKYFRGHEEPVIVPVHLVPADVHEVKVKEFAGGRLYCL